MRSASAWRDAGFHVADGTCPLVHRAHAQLRALVQARLFSRLSSGNAGHVEVQGLTGDFPQAVVLETAERHRQSTRRAKHASESFHRRRSPSSMCTRWSTHPPRASGRRGEFCDTVCQPTKNRQEALQKLLASCDTIVVVGGYNSNNTRQLVDAARAAGRRAIHIERPDELCAEGVARR